MKVYLDYNASAPIRPEVKEAVTPILFDSPAAPLGNASSVHWAGQEARRLLENARARIAARLARKPSEIVLTSGGTEADNLALFGVLASRMGGAEPPQLVISAVEHPAVLESAHALERRGARVCTIGVDTEGALDVDALAAALERPTALVSIMAVNNETGVISPLEPVLALCRQKGVPLHVDAVQAPGRTPLLLDADLISISAHKLGGLKGSGALAIRDSLALEPVAYGGSQERGRRAGSENVAGAVSLALALELSLDRAPAEQQRIGALAARLEAGLDRLSGTLILGRAGPRVAGTRTALFSGVDREALLQALDLEGVAASSGSACASGSLSPSHVLLAMGVAPDAALSAVRFSMGWGTSEAHVDRLLQVLPGVLAQVRGLS